MQAWQYLIDRRIDIDSMCLIDLDRGLFWPCWLDPHEMHQDEYGLASQVIEEARARRRLIKKGLGRLRRTW
jgi:hypothetical protein